MHAFTKFKSKVCFFKGLTLFSWGLDLKRCQALAEVHVGSMLGLRNSGQMTKVTASRNGALTVILTTWPWVCSDSCAGSL